MAQAVTLFDPLSCTSSSVALPDQGTKVPHPSTPPPSPGSATAAARSPATARCHPSQVRLQKVQAAEGGLILSRSDGNIFRVDLPDMQKTDLSLVVVRGRHGARQAPGSLERSSSGGASPTGLLERMSLGAPKLTLRVPPDRGASHSSNFHLHFAYSTSTGHLAFANARGEVRAD